MDNKDKILVMKFGGTSIGTLEAMTQAIHNVRETRKEWPNLVVVVSALYGVTDILIDSARRAAEGDQQYFYQTSHELRERHEKIINQLVPDLARQIQVKQDINHLIPGLQPFLPGNCGTGGGHPPGHGCCCRAGRTPVCAADGGRDGIERPGGPICGRFQLIVTDDHFTAARPDIKATNIRTVETIKPILAQRRIPVVTGFVAATPPGLSPPWDAAEVITQLPCWGLHWALLKSGSGQTWTA